MSPAYAHTDEQLDEWKLGWARRVIVSGLIVHWWDSQAVDLAAEYEDWATRHPRYFGRLAPTPTHTHPRAPQPSNVGSSVERWRPLVEAHFRAGDVDTALRIIACESRGNPDAKNPGSSAAGLWQFLKATWNRVAQSTGSPTYNERGPYDPTWATINAAWLRDRGSGWNQWECY